MIILLVSLSYILILNLKTIFEHLHIFCNIFAEDSTCTDARIPTPLHLGGVLSVLNQLTSTALIHLSCLIFVSLNIYIATRSSHCRIATEVYS